MKITKVKFKNFKSHVDTKPYDFSNKKHIHLLLGENGNGKTTFLEGISLAFFGGKMFKSDSYTKEYYEFVSSRLSNSMKSNQIELYVEYIDEGELYTLTRTYEIKENRIEQEIVHITKGKEEVETTPFLKKYNFEIMENFFVDGEKITKLISSGEINEFIHQFVEIAFNTVVFKQIYGDVEKINRGEMKSLQSEDHKTVEKDTVALEVKVGETEKEIGRKVERLQSLKHEEKVLRVALDKSGIQYGDRLEKLIYETEQISKEITGANDRVKQWLLKDVHSLLHKKHLKKIVRKLNQTRDQRLELIERFYKSLNQNKVERISEEWVPLELEKKLIEKSKNKGGIQEIVDVVDDLEKKKIDQSKKRETIGKSREGKEHLDGVNEYQGILDSMMKLESEIVELRTEQEKFTHQLELKQIELEKYKDELLSKNIADNFSIEKEKLKRIVQQYCSVKTEEIYRAIESKSELILKEHLLRKKELVDAISFKEGYLQVFKGGKAVNYANFSAGEKQMLIISILFAIIDLAKLDIPLVLDSFVGRLDMAHTRKVVQYLKNEITAQIILLSTDKEIDDKVIKSLKSKLGSFYILDNNGFSTKVKEGKV